MGSQEEPSRLCPILVAQVSCYRCLSSLGLPTHRDRRSGSPRVLGLRYPWLHHGAVMREAASLGRCREGLGPSSPDMHSPDIEGQEGQRRTAGSWHHQTSPTAHVPPTHTSPFLTQSLPLPQGLRIRRPCAVQLRFHSLQPAPLPGHALRWQKLLLWPQA
jgi:hypothetical protein